MSDTLIFKFISSLTMNSNDVSKLFSYSQNFNPQQTFGQPQNCKPQHVHSNSNLLVGLSLDHGRQQTRIRLLTSFQQSYLQDGKSISQPLLTQQDQKNHFAGSSSNSKMKNYSLSNFNQQRTGAIRTSEDHASLHAQIDKRQLLQKIHNLKQSIEEERYSLDIQQKLYEFLLMRIESRAKKPKVRDHHKIIEKAIDFMDAGDQFMQSCLKLQKMNN